MKKLSLGLALVLSVTLPAQVVAKAPATATATSSHLRFFAIEGGRNFRDIGGYRTRDGRTVRWGVLYRSGSLGKLGAAGQASISALQPHAIIDLRTTSERASDDGWAARMPGYWSRNYEMSFADIGHALFVPGGSEPTRVREMMQKGYRTLPEEQAASYRELFARLVEGKAPVIVNCTAGKDRTGVGTALVLTALGVPYATVRRDYLLSNGAPGMASLSAQLGGPFTSLPPESARLLMGVDGTYLDAAFAQIRQDHGSVDAYLLRQLGVGAKEKAALRRHMLRR